MSSADTTLCHMIEIIKGMSEERMFSESERDGEREDSTRDDDDETIADSACVLPQCEMKTSSGIQEQLN